MPLEQARNIEFFLAIKPTVLFCYILPKQAGCANDGGPVGDQRSCRMVYDHQMIAYAVEMISIAPREPCGDLGDSLPLSIENLVPELL